MIYCFEVAKVGWLPVNPVLYVESHAYAGYFSRYRIHAHEVQRRHHFVAQIHPPKYHIIWRTDVAANSLYCVGCAKLIVVIEEHDKRKVLRYLFHHIRKIQVGATVPGLFAHLHDHIATRVGVGGVVGAYDVEGALGLLQHTAAAALEVVGPVAGASEDG